MLDLNPARSEGGRPKCRCALFEDAAAAVDNLAPGQKLPAPDEPFPALQNGESGTDFTARITAVVRDLQRRVVRLECAAEGHPRAE